MLEQMTGSVIIYSCKLEFSKLIYLYQAMGDTFSAMGDIYFRSIKGSTIFKTVEDKDFFAS